MIEHLRNQHVWYLRLEYLLPSLRTAEEAPATIPSWLGNETEHWCQICQMLTCVLDVSYNYYSRSAIKVFTQNRYNQLAISVLTSWGYKIEAIRYHLLAAVGCCTEGTLRLLLEGHSNSEVCLENREDALLTAASVGKSKNMKVLIEHLGWDLQEYVLYRAFLQALEGGHLECARLAWKEHILLEEGTMIGDIGPRIAEVKRIALQGRTSKEMLALLLELGL